MTPMILVPNDIVWLAGFMDADGSIGMIRTGTSLVVQVQITGTDPRNRDRIVSIYNALDVKWNISDIKNDVRGLKNGRSNHARAWNINVTRRTDVLKLLQSIAENLCGKKDRADLCIKFLERRCKHTGRGSSALPYTEEDEKIFNEVRRLQRSYKEYANVSDDQAAN